MERHRHRVTMISIIYGSHLRILCTCPRLWRPCFCIWFLFIYPQMIERHQEVLIWLSSNALWSCHEAMDLHPCSICLLLVAIVLLYRPHRSRAKLPCKRMCLRLDTALPCSFLTTDNHTWFSIGCLLFSNDIVWIFAHMPVLDRDYHVTWHAMPQMDTWHFWKTQGKLSLSKINIWLQNATVSKSNIYSVTGRCFSLRELLTSLYLYRYMYMYVYMMYAFQQCLPWPSLMHTYSLCGMSLLEFVSGP